MDIEYFIEKREEARILYNSKKTIHNPYLNTDVVLNSDGFHHLQFSARRERNKQEQLLKFSLLPLAFNVIKKSGTLQEYRKILAPIGKPCKSDGLRLTKTVEYWGFIAIVGDKKPIKIRTIIRRIGDGNVIFWSVMPFSKLKLDGLQKFYSENIEDEEENIENNK